MDFSFLSPLAFRLLYALPLLLVPYLLQERNKRVVVPALFLYQGLPAATRRRLFGKLHLTPLFFLQLLILLLLITAAARPFLPRHVGKIAVVIDTSASMQAQAPSATGTLFELAKQQAADEIATLSAEDNVSLFASAPLPAAVSSSSEAQSPQQLLASLTVTDTPDPSDDILAAFFSQLVKEHGFQRIVFFTDRPLAQAVAGGALTVHTLGNARPNLSISSFRLYRSPFAPEDVEATVTIGGLSEGGTGSVEIVNAETGAQLASQPLPKPDKATVAFPRLPLASTYRVHLNVDDGLAVDNEAYAVLPPLSTVSILVVSPAITAVKSLGQIPNLKVETVSPQDYTPERAARFPAVLFHLTAPETLPATNAAFILPPEGNVLFPLGKGVSHPRITHWTVAHPLTDYVTFALLTPTYAQALLPVSWAKPVISSTIGSLVLAGERNNWRYVALGFDLLPYLGKQNLPASILTLNLLGWLVDHAGPHSEMRTGTTLQVTSQTTVRPPDGQIAPQTNGAVLLMNTGIYTLTENGIERHVAVNLNDAEESQLGRPLRLPQIASPAPVAPEKSGQPLWPWILLGVLLLLLMDYGFSRVMRPLGHTMR